MICPKSGQNELLVEFKFSGLVTLRYCIDIIVCNVNINNYGGFICDCQIAKFKSPAIFPDLQYIIHTYIDVHIYYAHVIHV